MSWRDVAFPNCGEVFKNPIFTQKRFTSGFSLYPLGTLTCPKCGNNGNSYKFRRPKPGEEAKKPTAPEAKTEPSEKDSKKLDESKFERP